MEVREIIFCFPKRIKFVTHHANRGTRPTLPKEAERHNKDPIQITVFCPDGQRVSVFADVARIFGEHQPIRFLNSRMDPAKDVG